MFLTILTVIIVLVILVVIHELGHFTAAKLLGIKVEEFGFGLPPRAWGKKIGETLYSLNWLPIGGFVRLYGEDTESPESVKKDRSRAFFAKKPWKRAIVLTAGVVMNFILGWILISYLFTMGLPVPKGHVEIRSVAEDSPAFIEGIQEGDIVSSITTPANEVVTPVTNQELVETVNRYLDQDIIIKLDRQGEIKTVTVSPRSNPPEEQGALGITIEDTQIEQYSTIPEALINGFSYSFYIIYATIKALGDTFGKLVGGQTKDIQVGGFILVGQVVGQARQFGIDSLLYVVSVLSLNLALINILPFPALDGGRLLFVTFEGLTGKRANPRWEMYLHQFGMIILLLLMLLITVNDILRIGRG